ncbi:MAG TPA: carboxylate-amine ligase [Actinomycetota bacterium]
MTEPRSLGVEEEYQLVDPATRELRQVAGRVLPAARPELGDRVQPELYRSMIETNTPVCITLAEVRQALGQARRALVEAAGQEGLAIAAAGTHPFSSWADQEVTDKTRYHNLAADYRQVFREEVVFGCHVHVGFDDREAAIQTMNRVRPWLPVLLALSANSPFWVGADTGYASFRTEVWNRWPTAGMPQSFASRAEYDALVETLMATGSVREPTKLYWDVRPSARQETLEFRVADSVMAVDEAVMVAGLVRALAVTAHAAADRGDPDPRPRPELLRAAKWRAARHGLEADLVDVLAGQARPAAELVKAFLAEVRPALEEAGDLEEVTELVRATLAGGTGAARQRQVFRRTGRLEDVVDLVVEATAR